MIIYRPDGSFAGIYQNLGAGAGLGIINNDVEELNGPTGGGTTNGSGYVPVVQEVGVGQSGVWTIVFGFPITFPSSSSYAFTNLENNETWDRATHQPTDWAVVSWDVTVSTSAAANDGGTMLTGRVFTKQYKTIITGNGNTTSPTFYMLSKEGIQYQLDFNDIDPYGFDFSANSVGIANGDGQPSYSSRLTSDYTISDDPSSWTPGNYYIFDPQGQDQGLFVTYKIFFNTPDSNMPNEAQTSNPITGDSYTTWLNNSVSTDPLDITGFEFTALDQNGDPTCFGNNFEPNGTATITFNSSLEGTVRLALDLNNDGDFEDPVDRILYGLASNGSNQLTWDGKDGMGNSMAITNGLEIDYVLEMRVGEMHIMIRDIENNSTSFSFCGVLLVCCFCIICTCTVG